MSLLVAGSGAGAPVHWPTAEEVGEGLRFRKVRGLINGDAMLATRVEGAGHFRELRVIDMAELPVLVKDEGFFASASVSAWRMRNGLMAASQAALWAGNVLIYSYCPWSLPVKIGVSIANFACATVEQQAVSSMTQEELTRLVRTTNQERKTRLQQKVERLNRRVSYLQKQEQKAVNRGRRERLWQQRCKKFRLLRGFEQIFRLFYWATSEQREERFKAQAIALHKERVMTEFIRDRWCAVASCAQGSEEQTIAGLPRSPGEQTMIDRLFQGLMASLA